MPQSTAMPQSTLSQCHDTSLNCDQISQEKNSYSINISEQLHTKEIVVIKKKKANG